MTDLPRPAAGDRGRASDDPASMLAATVGAWEALIAAVGDVDLAAVGRKDGRTAARTLVVVGSWPEGRALPAIRADALAGTLVAEPLDDIEARVVAAHEHDGRAAILAGLCRARDEVAAWAASPDMAREALLPVAGPLGVVPLGTLVAATAYQCAVAALDLAPAGVQAPDSLIAAGLASLVDSVGAVAAQQSATISIQALTPQTRILTSTDGGDWVTRPVTESIEGPALTCDGRLLLDIASGRASATAAYARGELRARDVTGLLAVAQVLARAPGLPGTDGLRAALQAYTASSEAARKVGDVISGAFRRWTNG